MTDLDIAIVGMAGRFPGARTLPEFWRNLAAGRHEFAPILPEQYLAAGGDPDALDDPSLVLVEAAVEGLDEFDAEYFGYSARDARLIDPQQRVFLQCALHAFEDAAIVPSGTATAVLAGSTEGRYYLHNVLPSLDRSPDSIEGLAAVFASLASSLPTRVAYELDLHGPAASMQTGCSSSLVAVHQACQELLNYRCDLALAGGATLNTTPHRGYRFEVGGPLSPDGRVRPFSADAAGMGNGDGVGVVLLKRLDDAIDDGDPIRAVIRGSAVNNDGSRKVGFTAPSVQGQTEVIVAALEFAELDASMVSYVEAHGTATPVGDPIEVTALTRAFRASTNRTGFCALGSVKSNIGHTDAAAGVAGLIKTVLALENGLIPASLGFDEPNPEIDFAASPFRVASEPIAWPRDAAAPRRAGVSAFGVGGTNAHVMVEEAPLPAPRTEPAPAPQLLQLSARTPQALAELSASIADALAPSAGEGSAPALADVARTLREGRAVHAHRRTVVADTAVDAAALLRSPVPAQPARDAGVAFLLPGIGAQYAGMADGLLADLPAYREAHEAFAAELRAEHGIELGLDAGPGTSILATIFAVEYALAVALERLGVRPTALLGHSMGEYVAAAIAGVMRPVDACFLVCERERLAREIGGAMTAVLASEDRVAPGLDERLSIATVNAPDSCTVAGPVDAIEALEARLEADGVKTTRLRSPAAGHSAMLEPMLPAYREAVRRVELRVPRLPVLSNVTGTWLTDEQATDPEYWVGHTRATVRFVDDVRTLIESGEAPFLLEVGPGRALTRFAQAALGRVPGATSMRHADAEVGDLAHLLDALGRLWCDGVAVDPPVDADARRISLPGYPFARTRHWIAPQPAGVRAPAAEAEGPTSIAWRARAPRRAAASESHDWTVVGRDAGAEALSRALADAGARARHRPTVEAALADAPDDTRFVLAEPDLDDYLALLATGRPVAACASGAHVVVGDEAVAPGARALVVARDALAAAGERAWRPVVDPGEPLGDLVADDLAAAAASNDGGAAGSARDRLVAELSALAAARASDATIALRGPRVFEAERVAVDADAVSAPRAALLADAPPTGVADCDRRAAFADDEARLREELPVEGTPQRVIDALDELGVVLIARTLREAGVDLVAGERRSARELEGALRVQPRYERLWRTALDTLERAGVVEIVDDEVHVRRAVDGDPEAIIAGLAGERPHDIERVRILAACGARFGEVISGDVEATEVVFPDGERAVYRDLEDSRVAAGDAKVYRRLVAEHVARLAREAGRPLRILEIGAGRGVLTWEVIDGLEGLDIEYHYTDIGRSFVLMGQQRARERGDDRLRFGVLDISRDPASQGYETGGFDVVLAFNVLHATPDLPVAYANAASLLRPGGTAVVLDVARMPRDVLLTAGLLEGVWHHTDRVRGDLPIVHPSGWPAIVEAAGLDDLVLLAGATDDPTSGDDHCLAIARRPAAPGLAGRLVEAGAAASSTVAEHLVVVFDAAGADATGDPGESDAPEAPGDSDAWIAERIARLERLDREHAGTLAIAVEGAASGPRAAATVAAHALAIAERRLYEGAAPWRVALRPGTAAAPDAYVRALLAYPDTCILTLAEPAQGASAPGPADETAEEAEARSSSAFNARPPMTVPYVEARTDLERDLVGIWETVLGLQGIGVDDDFFELGGESLLALQIVTRVRESRGVALDVRAVLGEPTVARLAVLVEASDAERAPRIGRAGRRMTLTADGELAGRA